MTVLVEPRDADPGCMSANIMHFARALRRAGIPVGPGQVIGATRAVLAAGLRDRDGFFHVLRPCFVSRPEHLDVFANVFRLFWRDPRYHEHMMALLAPAVRGTNPTPVPAPAERRAAEALLDGRGIELPDRASGGSDADLVEIDGALTYSHAEKLRAKDFEQMTLAEQDAARRAISALDIRMRPLVSRRTRVRCTGRLPERRATLRRAMRSGGEVQAIARRQRMVRPPNLVALLDISGSMSSYSRMLLQFLHAAAHADTARRMRVFGFTFGTRLTNITRHLDHNDPDAALAAVGREARDWDGGTRIGSSLRSFNLDWSRRCLGSGAVVLLVSDGLDRGDTEELSREAERLRLSCREFIWLNPLLRWDGFQPRAAGVKALIRHVHRSVPGHNLTSVENLADILSGRLTGTARAGRTP